MLDRKDKYFSMLIEYPINKLHLFFLKTGWPLLSLKMYHIRVKAILQRLKNVNKIEQDEQKVTCLQSNIKLWKRKRK